MKSAYPIAGRTVVEDRRAAPVKGDWLMHTMTMVFLAGFGLNVSPNSIAAENSASASSSSKVVERAQSLWSFQAIRPVIPPPSKDQSWVKNPIDAFVLSRLNRSKLSPASPANRLALLRRAYFDLIGLPPSPEQIEKFTRDRR